jgi:hypothetical protein
MIDYRPRRFHAPHEAMMCRNTVRSQRPDDIRTLEFGTNLGSRKDNGNTQLLILIFSFFAFPAPHHSYRWRQAECRSTARLDGPPDGTLPSDFVRDRQIYRLPDFEF